MMARAVTSNELLKLRGNQQYSKLYLAIDKPATVYSALVNQTSFDASVGEITYDGGSGTLTNVKIGMTMYVGSSAGAYDKGMARIRKTPSATVFYIGESSEIAWADNLYLTIVDEFALWPKHLTIVDNVTYMDYDVAYTDQHKYPDPVPVLGPDAVLWLPTGGTVTHTRDGSSSWVCGGSITAHSWGGTITGGTVQPTITGGTTSAPTYSFTAPGTYRISDTVTASNGKTNTGYRSCYVFSAAQMPVSDFRIENNPTGDYETGGWTFKITLYDHAALSDIRDGAKIILFAKDYYNGIQTSIGPITGYENIIASGRVVGETIKWNKRQNSCSFTIKGPHGLLSKIPGYPVGVKNINGADPTDWIFFRDLTVDKALWHFLHWRTTATGVMDITLTGDTSYLPAGESPAGNLWKQITDISNLTILAKPLCDRYGRLFVEVDTQVVPIANRTGFPTVQAITTNDCHEEIEIERRIMPEISVLETSGVSYDGSTATVICSRAPGVVFKRYGSIESKENLLFSSQAQANTLTGNMLAQMNNPYPSVVLKLAQNNRMIDICPRQYVTITISAADTERGIVWTAQKLIPRRVEFEYNSETGLLTTSLDCEAETSGPAGIYVTPPTEPTYNYPDEPGIITLDDLGYIPTFSPYSIFLPPDYIPTQLDVDEDNTCPNNAPTNGPFNLLVGSSYESGQNPSSKFRCVMRSSAHTNITTYTLNARFWKKTSGVWSQTLDDNFYDVKAYDMNGTLVATGIHNAVDPLNPHVRTGYFNIAANANVNNFVLDIESTLRIPIDHVYAELSIERGTLISSGEQVWWRKGNKLGVNWTGVELTSKYSTDIMRFLFYPESGYSFAEKPYHIKGSMDWVTTNGYRPAAGYKWEYWTSDLKHFVIQDASKTVDNDFTSMAGDTWIGIQMMSREDTGYFKPPERHSTAWGTFEFWPDPDYRIVIDSLQIWNVCPPTSTEFET